MRTQHPLLAYNRQIQMGGLWDDIVAKANTELDKLKAQATATINAEKDKLIANTLTNAQKEVSTFITTQADKLISDPAKLQQVKDAASNTVTEKITNTVKPIVDYAIANPKRTALIVGGSIVGIIALLTLSAKGATAGIIGRVRTNPSRKKKKTSKRRKSARKK